MASRDGLLHALSGARRTAWCAILVGSACVLNACGGGGGGGSGSDSPPTPPTVSLTSSASSVASGSSVTLTWSSTDATSCIASGGWAGTKALSGSESIGPLSADASYALSCSGAGGSANRTVSVTVTVAEALRITTDDLPNGAFARVYGQTSVRVTCHLWQPGCICTDSYPHTYCRNHNNLGYRYLVTHLSLSATGGTPPYSWSWAPASNSSLPPGLTLADSSITGTPTAVGTYYVVVTVADSASPIVKASKSYTITIAPPPPPVIKNTAAPASGTLNVPYSFVFSAASGLAPLTWSETGALPSGLSLSSSGVLSGTPTIVGSFPITIRVHDAVGQDAVPQNFTIDVYAHGFQATGNMTSARASVTATVLQGGRVLVIGGDTVTAEVFDPASGALTTAGSMTTPRVYHTATLLANGKVLVAGGQDSGGVVLATAEIFDPTTGTFTLVGSMSTPRATHAAALLDSGRVLVTGGRDASGAPLAAAEIFDPATGVFARTGDMGTPRFEQTTTLLRDGRVLVTGGVSTDGHATETAELFDPVAGVFTPTGGLRSAVYSHVATLLSDGRVLITGGFRYDANRNGDFGIASADVFDPASGAFIVAPNMTTARANHTATLLADGTALITGGVDSENRVTASAEVFDPSQATFSPTGQMATPRYWHAASLLNDGRVLVTGGSDGDTGSLFTAELYD